MTRLMPIAVALLLAGCATHANPMTVRLPMPIPAMPSQDVPKDRPLPVGSVVAVPADVRVMDVGGVAGPGEVVRVNVEWPGARGFQLALRAEGSWPSDARVRVLGADGVPAHIDHWAPAVRSRWWSAHVEGDTLTIEVSGAGRGSRLVIEEAAAFGSAR